MGGNHIRTIPVLILAFLFWTPGVLAESQLIGEVVPSADIVVEGVGDLASREGLLDISEGVSGLRIRWSAATLDLRHRDDDTVVTGVPGENFTTSRSAGGSVRTLAGGSLNLTCGAACQAFVIVDGRGELGVSSTFSSSLMRLQAPRVYSVGFPPGQLPALDNRGGESQSTYWYSVEVGAFGFSSQSTIANLSHLDSARPRMSGEVILVVERARVDIAFDEGETEVIDTNPHRVPNEDFDPVGTGRTHRTRTSYAVISLTNASIEAEPGAPFAFFAISPRMVADATVSTERANGFLSLGGQRFAVEDEALRIDGKLNVDFGRSNAAASDALTTGMFQARFTGNARVVEIGGFRVHDAPADALRNTAAVSGGVAALLVLLFIFKGSILAAFYSRIERSQVLDNANRRRVHEFIATSEGASIADVCRELGLARAVALHHLRLLEAHQFVVSKRHGRVRVFGVPGAPLSVQASRQADLPEDGVRRRLAEAIARAPAGLTQRELVDSIDVSQRLISYHVRKLESAGLVIATDDFPRKYRATAQLAVSSRGGASEAAHANS